MSQYEVDLPVGGNYGPKENVRRLLLLSCSARKLKLTDRPAINIYDGPSYKILRKHLDKKLDVLILSAKYGIIESSKHISFYDLKMTKQKAVKFRKRTTQKILSYVHNKEYSEIFVDMGSVYLEALDRNSLSNIGIDIRYNNGPIGVRLHKLKKWLEETSETEKERKD